MKKILLASFMLLAGLGVHAQQYLRVWQGEESKRVALADAETMQVNSNYITIAGSRYAMSEVDSITIVKTIYVQWNGTSASVVVPDAAKGDITVSQNGGHVKLTNTNTTEEMEFVLSGTSADGSFTYNGAYKCKFHLAGLNLTSTQGGALDIQCGKRIDLILQDGTANVLSDAKTGTQKAALYCKGHLELQGMGSLTVSGNARHAVSTKEYLLLKKNTGTISIAQAASDALHVGQYFQMSGGTLAITDQTVGDGIQVDATDDATDALNGQILIKGGIINATIAHEDCKGIKNGASESGAVPAGNISITGGTITINANGNGSRGIQTDASMLIADSDAPTAITITAAGGLCTQKECAEDPHRCMGIKVDGNLNVTGGTTKVSNTGKKSRAIKVGGTYSKSNAATVDAVITQ